MNTNGEFLSMETLRQILDTTLVSTIITILIIYVAAKLIIRILRNTFFKYNRLDQNISDTLESLTVRVIYILFFIVGVFTVLDAFGVNTASLVATAGVGSIAIGFGAQSLVKDIIAGAFILIEGQYFVGDEVVIDGISGNVVDFGIRSTKIKDFDTGAIHYIANGIIKTVENRSQDDQFTVVKLDIPDKYPLDTLFADVREALSSLEDDSRIIVGPELFGLVDGPERYNRLFIKATVTNGATYAIGREIRKAVQDKLKAEGYVISSPVILEGDEDVVL